MILIYNLFKPIIMLMLLIILIGYGIFLYRGIVNDPDFLGWDSEKDSEKKRFFFFYIIIAIVTLIIVGATILPSKSEKIETSNKTETEVETEIPGNTENEEEITKELIEETVSENQPDSSANQLTDEEVEIQSQKEMEEVANFLKNLGVPEEMFEDVVSENDVDATETTDVSLPENKSVFQEDFYINSIQPSKEVSYVFVGDSRTVGIEKSVINNDLYSNCYFIGKIGSGIEYLENTAIFELEDYIANHDGNEINIIFNSGVNDLGNIDSYIAFHEEMQEKYSQSENIHLYFAAVMPVKENSIYPWNPTTFNQEISDFNESMYLLYGENFIDTNMFLQETGFSSSDGLHYSANDYERIIEKVIGTVEENQ